MHTDNLYLETKLAQKILIVDDEIDTIELVQSYLDKSSNYKFYQAQNGEEALNQVYQNNPDLVITDGMMPHMDGFEFVKKLKEHSNHRLLPVIMISGLKSIQDRVKGIEAGVDDFITKPFDIHELSARVKSLLKLKSYTDELENAEKVIFSLATAIESRDEYTGGHCQRLADYGKEFSQSLGLSHEEIKNVIRGGYLHDIGKIMVPDYILRKTGPLNEAEWEEMRKHPEFGEHICRPLKTMRNVLPIIRYHQERWDGSGYPDKLVGYDIPFLARVVATVDFYDALTTERPYRRALSKDEAITIMEQETSDNKWDPDLISKFIELVYKKF